MEIRKWKSPILGVAQIVLRDVFLASIFVAYVEPKLFFTFAQEKSPVQPLVLCKDNDVASMPHHSDGVACMPRHFLTRFDELSGL